MMLYNSELMKCLLLMLAAISQPLMAGGNDDFIYDIPDFTQSHIRGSQHFNGYNYCAPAAVSNSLYWMANMRSDQANLIKSLASSKYMNTDTKTGTTTAQLLNGVDAMAIDLFGGYRNLEYQGWKRHPSKYSTALTIPDFNWITAGVSEDSAVWLNVGWYQYDRDYDTYHRVGGHWVTLVGYDGNMLIIHDPAPRAGHSFANELVYTSIVESGTLRGKVSGLPRQATGHLRLGRGMHIKSIADVAIVDGAVRFRR